MRFGRTLQIQTRPTIQTAAYEANDVVGGVQELPLRGSAVGSGLLTNVTIADLANQKPALTILFFKAELAGTYTDGAAASPDNADYGELIGTVSIAGSDWTTVVANGLAVVTKDVSIGIKGDEMNIVRAVAITSGTPDYAAADQLIFNFSVQAD